MKNTHGIKRLFRASAICLCAMPATILFMQAAARAAETNILWLRLTGAAFWGFAAAGYVLIAIARRRCKSDAELWTERSGSTGLRQRLSDIFKNAPAAAALMTAAASLLAVIVISFTAYRNEYVVYVLLFLLLLSIHMFCLFNSRVYAIIKNTRREENYE